MLERYKLRLGDGTILGVDYDGLSTWLVDRRAMVQAASTGQWHPLNQFLARERAAARRAAQQKASARDPLALAISKPLPLVYPKPREVQKPVRGEGPTPGPAAAPPASEPMELAPLAEPVNPAGSGPLVESTPSDEIIPFAEYAPLAASADISLAQPLGEMVFSELPATSEPASIGLAPAPAFEEEPPLFVEPLDDAGDVGLPSGVVLPVEPVLASEPVAEAPQEEEQAIPPVALAPPVFEPLPPPVFDAQPPRAVDAQPPPAVDAPPPLPDIPWGREALDDPPLVVARPSLQVLADDPSAARAGSARPTGAPDDGLPIIRLKPLDDEKPSRTVSEPEAEDVGAEGVYEEPPERGQLQQALLRVGGRAASLYDALLTGWIEGLDRWFRAPSTAASKREQLSLGVSAWVARLGEKAGRIARREAPPRPVSSTEVAPSRVAESRAAEPLRPALHELLKAPPPLSQLPTLRLAHIPQAEEPGDVYPSESRHHAAWRSMKRIVGWSTVIAGLLLAAVTWEAWVPRTAELGTRIATELDAIKEARDRREEQGRALREATERLPHLAPETIRLVLAASPTGVLDPAEAFYLASEAADRGATALTAEEAQELTTLRAELLATLRPSERARVREYDSTRARRFVFPFESGGVLEVYARGTQAVPEESRARLRALLAKAIAAGLVTPPAGAPQPVATP